MGLLDRLRSPSSAPDPSDLESLNQQIKAIDWWHPIDLGNGVVTPGIDCTPSRLAEIRLPEDLRGKSVLDIGAWDGFFSFEAERRGARRVLATDSFSGTAAAGARRRPSSRVRR
jgi:tRNA (mo5U34)-methyltransferase